MWRYFHALVQEWQVFCHHSMSSRHGPASSAYQPPSGRKGLISVWRSAGAKLSMVGNHTKSMWSAVAVLRHVDLSPIASLPIIRLSWRICLGMLRRTSRVLLDMPPRSLEHKRSSRSTRTRVNTCAAAADINMSLLAPREMRGQGYCK
jgi:hypothetical protein